MAGHGTALRRLTWGDLVRQVFPDADEQMADYLLWNRTPYPFVVGERVRHHLLAFKLVADQGPVCDFCNTLGVRRRGYSVLCDRCAEAIDTEPTP